MTIDSDLLLAFDEMTEEIDQVIGEEVHNLFTNIQGKGRAVWDTGNFFRKIAAPVRWSKSLWKIQLRAKYSSILWSGRRKVGGRYYGSENWYAGGEPMLRKTENDIIRRTDAISK